MKNVALRAWEFISLNKYPLLLLVITVLIFITNYVPDTYLVGWDSLQTELNPWLGVKRALYSVWEEYQSFGLPAGMAHGADLVRSVIVLFLSFFLPQNLIRYIVHCVLIYIGSLGTFTLLKDLGFNGNKKSFAFIGALFYILNFGTVQIMFLPLETFSFFLAFLPWELWIFNRLITSPQSKRNIVVFALINFLATPQVYVQTLFVVYVLILGLFGLGIFLQHKKFSIIKGLAISFLIIFIINSFWLLPQIYYVVTGGNKIVQEAKINQISTEDVIYQNKDKGNIKDFVLMQGFYYDLFSRENQLLFTSWKEHFQSPIISVLLYILVVIIFIGIFSWSAYHLPFLLIYGLLAFIFLNDTPVIKEIHIFLRQNQFTSQIFRSHFTKFIIPYALISSYFFSRGLLTIQNLFLKLTHNLSNHLKVINLSISLLSCILLIMYALPVFRGAYFSVEMKKNIPQDYLDVIEYFRNQDKNKRIALLPEYTYWGWFFHNWGYVGSGFIWYGIEQPIVSRTFDVWSEKSEGYFWELKSAAEAEDITKFEQILEKYNIDVLLLDKSYLANGGNYKAMQYDRLEMMLNSSTKITKTYQSTLIDLYEIKNNKEIQDFVSLDNQLQNIGPEIKFTDNDSAYFNHGDYLSDNNTTYDIYYPFIDLMSQTKLEDKRWTIQENADSLIFQARIPFDPDEYWFSVSTLKTILEKENVYVVIPKILKSNIDLYTPVSSCGSGEPEIKTEKIEDNFFIGTSQPGVTCFGYSLSSLEQREGYIVKIRNENWEGRRLFFYVLDQTKRQTYLEDRLDSDTAFYVIAPHYYYGLGYDLNFQNNSYANEPGVNYLDEISVYQIPYDEIKQLSFTRKDYVANNIKTDISFRATKENYHRYNAKLQPTKDESTLILYQEYNDGWLAFKNSCEVGAPCTLFHLFPFIFGEKLTNHVKINNWANGWIIPPSSEQTNIILIFWPQYLQFIGFGLLIFGSIFLYLKFVRK